MFIEKILRFFTKNKSNGKSAITFPTYDELSYEQKEAVNMPFDKNNVIIGAPGTGKTIVAIHRIKKIYEVTKQKILMLVFNRALYNYIVEVRKALGIEEIFEVSTVNDFVYYNLYNGKKEGKEKDLIDKPVPFIGNNKYNTDWMKVKDDVKKIGRMYDHIVIDEGQDFNVSFYETLRYITKYITVFADPNQSIQKDGASISDILRALNKESYFALTLNYRNSRNIVDFTRRYCYDKSIFAESYRDKDDLEVLNFDEDNYIGTIKEIICRYDENTNIGIIVPNIKDKNGNPDRKYEYGLYQRLKKELNKKYKVSVYYNENTQTYAEVKDLENVDFSINSIKIFNYATIRGLDFDVVILIDNISDNIESIEEDDNKAKLIKELNKIYIASTRAKEKLYVLRNDANDEVLVVDNDITYGYFDNINGIPLEECLKNAREAEEDEKPALALYYYHYAIAVLGIEDKEVLKRVLCSFANLCINFNKADFALGSIFNYSYKYNDVKDKDLIFFYQSALIHSYNSDFIFNNIDKFFNRISVLDKDDIDDLLSEFYNEYFIKCNAEKKKPDANFASEEIKKYNYDKLDAYKYFKERCKEIFEENSSEDDSDGTSDEDEDSSANIDIKEEIDKMTGHDLLCGSYIKIIAGSNKNGEGDFYKKAKPYKFLEKDFDFNLDYKKFANQMFDDIKKHSDKPIAVIIGSLPHSTKGKGDYSSYLVKIKQPGYPKVFETDHGKDLSLSAFKNKLLEIIDYLKTRLYRKRRAML